MYLTPAVSQFNFSTDLFGVIFLIKQNLPSTYNKAKLSPNLNQLVTEDQEDRLSLAYNSFDNKFLNFIERNLHQSLFLTAIVGGFLIRWLFSQFVTGILHPDEIYQSLEMAHVMVYDSGIIPPEFKLENRQVESYATSRSWIFPLIFATIMRFGEYIGLDYHSGIIPMIYFILVLNSTFMIYSASKFSFMLTKSKNVQLYTAYAIAFWFRFVEYTIRPFNNTFFLPILFYGLYRVLLVMERKKVTAYDSFIVMFALGVTTYVRLDLLFLVLLVFIVTFNKDNYNQYIKLAMDGFVGWIIGILTDFYYYKEYVIVPYKWFLFNIIESNSDLFGVTPLQYYFEELILYDGLFWWVASAVTFSIILFILGNSRLELQLFKNHKQQILIYNRMVIATFIEYLALAGFWRNLDFDSFSRWLLYQESWEPLTHKELRFFIGSLVLIFITMTIFIDLLLKFIAEIVVEILLTKTFKFKNKILLTDINYYIRVLGGIGLILLLLTQSFNSLGHRYHAEQYSDLNEALRRIGQTDDVTGIVVIAPWFLTGGFTVLHRSDIDIRFYDFDDGGSPKTGSDFEQEFRGLRFSLDYWQELNYIVLPRYQRHLYPGIVDELLGRDFFIQSVVYGSAEIWQLKVSQLSTSS